MPDLSNFALLWAALVLAVAGYVRGYSGFGFSAVTVAGLAFVVEPAVAVTTAILLEVIASLIMAPAMWKDIDWRGALVLLLGGFIGNPAGVFALELAPPDAIKAAVYLYVLAVAILLGFARPQERRLGNAAWFAVGLVAGAINGATALSGLFIVTVMTLTATPPSRMRATLSTYFFLSDFYAAGLLGWRGFIDRELVVMLALILPVVAVGIWIGSRRFGQASEAQFRRATLTLLAALAVAGLGQLGWKAYSSTQAASAFEDRTQASTKRMPHSPSSTPGYNTSPEGLAPVLAARMAAAASV